MSEEILVPLKPDDREQFILDNQEAFNYGALEEFGRRDDHFEEDEQIISRETIERSIDGGEAYRIMQDGQPVGGVVIKVDGERGDLDLLFVSPKAHSKGIGYAAWCAVERLYPEVTVWETVLDTGRAFMTGILGIILHGPWACAGGRCCRSGFLPASMMCRSGLWLRKIESTGEKHKRKGIGNRRKQEKVWAERIDKKMSNRYNMKCQYI